MTTALLLDVTGIQEYVFSGHRLGDIAGASQDIENLLAKVLLPAEKGLNVRRIYAAAGNAAYLADDAENAKAFLRRVSRTLAERFPGLEIIAATGESDSVKEAYEIALRSMDLRKLTQPRSTRFEFPGLHPESRRFAPILKRDYGFAQPVDAELMLCKPNSEFKLTAVVNIDAMKMGERWHKVLAEANDGNLAETISAHSSGIVDVWESAWDATLEAAAAALGSGPYVHSGYPAGPNTPTIEAAVSGTDRFFPFRRIYQGGDDLVFLCDARVAIGMATHLVRELEARSQQQFGTGFTFSVGVAFVRNGFPFSRAVQLAEQLRSAAKKKAYKLAAAGVPASTINWSVMRTGHLDPSFADRAPGSTMKPYRISRGPSTPDNEPVWDDFENTLLPKLWTAFKGQHNKLKDLGEAAQEGGNGAAVDRLRTLRPIKGVPSFDFLPHMDQNGFFGAQGTPLADAIEISEIHFPFPITPGPNGGAA